MAVAFLVVLLAEWGGHSLAFAHADSGEGEAVHSRQDSHEDLCKTLVRCSDSSRQEQSVPNFGHDVVQRNHFFDPLANALHWGASKDPRIGRSGLSDIYRPVSPPFLPPQLS